MGPCRFVRITVSSLALKVPPTLRPSRSVIHPSASAPVLVYSCEIHLRGFPKQSISVPIVLMDAPPPPDPASPSIGFHLNEDDVRRLAGRGWLRSSGSAWLRVSVYSGRSGGTCSGVGPTQLVGHAWVEMDLDGVEERAKVFRSGWIKVGKGGGRGSTAEEQATRLHLLVRADPDPRFVFQFGGEPECSPVVFQVQGNTRQPVFSCKFSNDRYSKSRSLRAETPISRSSSWSRLRSFGSDRERPKERKGWMIVIHDLSGSPVAAASMVTPFVASPGSDRVSQLNPGAWLILRPNGYAGGEGWKPWGRLEAWRERGNSETLGYRFELTNGPVIAESSISTKKGGKFVIDTATIGERLSNSPMNSPSNTRDIAPYKGLVMVSTVEGEGKCSKPHVQVGLKHVKCMADAAVFIALSAAIDLSMDACRPFSQKLRKELRHGQQHGNS